MEAPEMFTCQKCHKQIYKMNELFHLATCPGLPLEEPETQQSWRTPSRTDAPLFPRVAQQQPYPKVEDKYRKEVIHPHQQKLEKDEFKTICPKCTQYLEDSQIQNHLQTCEYDPCRYCLEYYPRIILLDHQHVCDARSNINRSQSLIEEESRSTPSRSTPMRTESFRSPQQSNSYRDHFDTTSNMRAPSLQREDSATSGHSILRVQNSQPNNYVTIQTIERTPYGIIHRTQTVPGYMVPGLGTQSRQQRNPMQMDSLMITGLDEMEDEEIVQFERNFLNHGNFMRMNRFRFGPGFLESLLNQLSNPNQGMSRDNLRNLEEMEFKKNPDVNPGEEEKCAICITEFEEKEKVKKLPCKHLFHVSCVDTWLVQNSHCPICKTDINEAIRQGNRRNR